MTQTFSASDFQNEVLDSDIPVLVDFWAEWCPPCKLISPIIDELSAATVGEFKVGKVNAELEPDLAARYNVSALPTLLVFKGGRIVNSLRGVYPKAVLLQALQNAV